MEERKSIFEQEQKPMMEDPVLQITKDPYEPLKVVETLWRCRQCGRGVRTYDEIKSGKRLWCRRCGSTQVIPAWPHWWEVILLYFRTTTHWYKPWTGTIFLAAGPAGRMPDGRPIRKY